MNENLVSLYKNLDPMNENLVSLCKNLDPMNENLVFETDIGCDRTLYKARSH
jgi:hypothetical protein